MVCHLVAFLWLKAFILLIRWGSGWDKGPGIARPTPGRCRARIPVPLPAPAAAVREPEVSPRFSRGRRRSASVFFRVLRCGSPGPGCGAEFSRLVQRRRRQRGPRRRAGGGGGCAHLLGCFFFPEKKKKNTIKKIFIMFRAFEPPSVLLSSALGWWHVLLWSPRGHGGILALGSAVAVVPARTGAGWTSGQAGALRRQGSGGSVRELLSVRSAVGRCPSRPDKTSRWVKRSPSPCPKCSASHPELPACPRGRRSPTSVTHVLKCTVRDVVWVVLSS